MKATRDTDTVFRRILIDEVSDRTRNSWKRERTANSVFEKLQFLSLDFK